LAKELGKRNEIWREILQTEKAYFQSLVMLYETFFKPLKMKSVGSTSSQDHKILTEKQIFKIFQNIEDVKNSAKNMWKKLEETCKNWPESAPKIGQVGVSLMQEIRSVYSPYVKGLSKAMTNLAKTRKASQQFSDFLDRTGNEFSGAEPSLPLHSLLMLPLHRMSQYETYMKELLVLTPPEHVDYVDLTRASREMAALNFELNPAKTEAFKAQKLCHINVTLKGPSVPNILAGKVEGTRIYIREGPILSIGDRRNKRSYLFLFTDSLVIADINEATEEKLFDFMLPLAGAEIKEVHDSQGGTIFNNASTSGGGIAQHLFAIIKENKKVVLGCYTLSERASWMNDISTVINELGNLSKRGSSKSFPTKLQSARGSAASSSFNTAVIPPRSEGSIDGLSSPRRAGSSVIPLGLSGTNFIPSEAFNRSLSRQHATKSLEHFLETVPGRVKLARLTPRDCLAKFRGPADEENETEKYTSFAAAKVTSTYPFDKERNMRSNDPIADHCGLAAWGNRILAVVADGAGRGFRAQQAASRAVDTFISDFVDPKTVPQDLRELSAEMLRSLGHVHENIIAGTQVVWDAGTTTLLASFLVEVEPTSATNNHKWCLVNVNVGDGKVFIWNKTSKTVREISNRLAPSPSDARDPGGRLGPYIYQGAPDLRDLSFSHAFCGEDDFVILCSDGVYDNFDPEMAGLQPKDVSSLVGNGAGSVSNLVSELRPEQIKGRWDQLDAHTSAELRAACRIRTLEQIIEGGDASPNARSLMRSVVNFCVRQTRSVREFYEQNPNQVVPNDYQQYPGVMDHLTCLAFQVGNVSL
jgi:serine/threonine protein phosphatase PrpC